MLPRIPLCTLPTPCHRLDRVSEDLCADVWIKRDDLTGFAMGGNKGRKLEYLIAGAVEAGCTAVVTCGAAQSNFIRQLAAACAVVGIECHAAVMRMPYAALHGKPQLTKPTGGGNLVLDALFGAHLQEFADDDWEVLYDHAERIGDDLEAHGHTVYRIPVGGSSPVGAYAFVVASAELPGEFDFVVCPTSSGSTHAGLAHAFYGSRTRVIGISCDPEPEILDDLMPLIHGLDDFTPVRRHIPREEVDFRLDWAGEAYGIPSPEGEAALEYLAHRQGILLDPVYSAKAFAGFLDLIRSGEISGRVLFWHTGGMPALFTH
jgi:1-aminocyclopropane-1-carboxylate deaminase/D-cysteine desulfhydrase-like pyridoxal-dependent ACC family enzyme